MENAIEVVSNLSSNGLLLKSSIKNENIVLLDMHLDIGDLKDLKNYKRSFLKSIGYNVDVVDYSNKIKFLLDNVRNNKKIRIWSSHKNSNEYMTVLYICNLLEKYDAELYVVYSDERSSEAKSVGELDKKEIKNVDALERKLLKEEIIMYSKIWNSLLNDNSDIRYIDFDNIIKSCSYDYLEEKILSELKKYNEIRIGKFISNLKIDCIITEIDYSEYPDLVERLINKDKIKVIKKCDDLFDCIIKKEKFISNKKGEYTDLYDENKNLTGEKLFREKGTKLIVPKGRYSVVVLAFIENSKGEFLFQMTSKRKKNVWATTGGHVKSGQTSKEAIIEEIKEELGIDINENEIKLFKTYKYDDAFKDVFYIKKDIDINSLTYQEDEVEYVKYLTKDEILDLINNDGNIRKTNIDAFLELIKSYEY